MSNLSPVKITIIEDSLIVTAMISQGEGQAKAWKKFSIRCETPQELWATIQGIHHKGAQALAEQSLGINFSCPASNNIHVNYDYIAEAVQAFKAKGGIIKHLAAGASAFKTSAIDLEALLADLDAIPSLPTDEPIDTDNNLKQGIQPAPLLAIGENLTDSEAA